MDILRKINAVLLLLGILVFPMGCVVDPPVEREYFDDLSRIKGGEKPTPPSILGVTLLPGMELVISFSSAGAVDPDTGSNSELVYLVYYTSGDSPPAFPDESDYYDEKYYLGYVREADYTADPKDITGIYVNPAFSGTLHFWMTSWDGGRESDHSNFESVVIP